MSKIGDSISEALGRFEHEFSKFESGNHSAGVRARKALMDIKKIAGDGRKEVMDMKPVKKSAAKLGGENDAAAA